MTHLDVLLEMWNSLEKCFSNSAPPPPQVEISSADPGLILNVAISLY